MDYFEDQHFEKKDFSETRIPPGEYESCRFDQCNFSNADLNDLRFTDCSFTGCNFSLTSLKNTSFVDIVFKDCKMLGLHFEDCNKFLFTSTFEHCTIRQCGFIQMKIKEIRFTHCDLRESDFSGADLAASVFEHCDLTHTLFDQTNLEEADLTSAFNYSIDPEKNRISKAMFSAEGLPGLLEKYKIIVR